MKSLKSTFSPDAARHTFLLVCRRFPFPLMFASLLAVWEIFSICEWADDLGFISGSISWALAEGFLLTLAANLWCEFGSEKRILKPVLLSASALVAADLVLLLVRGGSSGSAETIGRSAVVAALATAILFLPTVRRYGSKQLWTYTIWQLSAIGAAVFISIALGISCFIIFGTLDILFNISNYRLPIAAAWIVAWWIPCIIYLSGIPRPSKIVDALLPPKTIYGAFSKNVTLPIALIYTTILYIYATKILLTWTLPNASVTWMVTGLMVTVLMMLYGLQRYGFGGNFTDSAIRIASLARRWMPVLLLPLLVLMSVGLIYRIREYGITTSRLYVAAFNIWAYATMLYLIARRTANLNIVAASFSLVFVLVSIIPCLNFTSITNRVLRSEVVESLHLAGAERLPVTKEEARKLLENLDKQTAINTASKIEYLDDWRDHSRVADIVCSDGKVFSFQILPEKYDEIKVEAVEPYYEFCYDGAVPIPSGYTKVISGDRYSFDLNVSDDGTADAKIDNYTVMFDLDSLRNSSCGDSSVSIPVVNESGDSATIVFTALVIDTDTDVPAVRHATYYIFTK